MPELNQPEAGEYGYIYKTTNLISNRVYIGKHKGNFDSKYFGSGKLLRESLLRHGKENFKVEKLISADSKIQLNNLEIEYISKYRSLFPRDEMYNIAEGGEGGKCWSIHPLLGVGHSQETKDKLSKSKKGIKAKPFSEEHRRKLGEANKRRVFTKEMRENCRQGQSKKLLLHLETCQCLICKTKRGEFKHTEETKNKIRLMRLGKCQKKD